MLFRGKQQCPNLTYFRGENAKIHWFVLDEKLLSVAQLKTVHLNSTNALEVNDSDVL